MGRSPRHSEASSDIYSNTGISWHALPSSLVASDTCSSPLGGYPRQRPPPAASSPRSPRPAASGADDARCGAAQRRRPMSARDAPREAPLASSSCLTARESPVSRELLDAPAEKSRFAGKPCNLQPRGPRGLRQYPNLQGATHTPCVGWEDSAGRWTWQKDPRENGWIDNRNHKKMAKENKATGGKQKASQKHTKSILEHQYSGWTEAGAGAPGEPSTASKATSLSRDVGQEFDAASGAGVDALFKSPRGRRCPPGVGPEASGGALQNLNAWGDHSVPNNCKATYSGAAGTATWKKAEERRVAEVIPKRTKGGPDKHIGRENQLKMGAVMKHEHVDLHPHVHMDATQPSRRQFHGTPMKATFADVLIYQQKNRKAGAAMNGSHLFESAAGMPHWKGHDHIGRAALDSALDTISPVDRVVVHEGPHPVAKHR